MNRQRLVLLAVVALILVSAGMYLSSRRTGSTAISTGGALLPDFGKNMAGVTSLSLRKGAAEPQVTVHKQGEQWTVVQRADYPADMSRLRKLLLALTDAKIVEEKTSDPANFAQIGVDDPKAADAAGTEISYTDASGSHALIVGKPLGNGNFVRRGGENQSYEAEPGFYLESEPRFWIEPKLFDIPVADIQRVDIKVAGGPAYTLRRVPAPAPKDKAPAASAASAATPPEPPAPDQFALDGVPGGRKAAESGTLAPSATIYSAFSADDVAPAAQVDFSKPTTAQVTLKDGSVVNFTGVVAGDKHWLQVSGLKDAALAARTSGRAFEVAGYRYDGIFRPLEQLLVPLPPKEDAKKDKEASAGKGPKPPRS